MQSPGDSREWEDDDKDSAVGSLLDDDTETLNSFIRDFRYENRRRYHSYGQSLYWGPNDEEASSNMDLAHHMYNLTLKGELFLAPIKNPQRILDLGTGTGIWAVDMADRFPEAEVIGTDLSPIQPQFVPPNCIFEIDDFTQEWTYPENNFDFIHGRELFGCVGDWDALFREMYTHTKPGGYVEMVEHSVWPKSDDGTVGPDHFFNLWGKTVTDLGERWNKSFTIWEELETRLKRAGFEEIEVVKYKWPTNGWPGDPEQSELGKWNQYRLYYGIEGYLMRLLTMAGEQSYEEAQMFLASMRRALRDTTTHAYLDGVVVYGRKPLHPTSSLSSIPNDLDDLQETTTTSTGTSTITS